MGWFSRNKPDANAPIKVLNDEWSLYFKWIGENKQWPVMFFFDETYAERTPDDYNDGVEFTTYYRAKDPAVISESGMPLPEVNADLQKWESTLVERIEASQLHVKYVARLVGAARKTYRFQARNGEALLDVLRQWAGEIKHVERTEERVTRGWKQYENVVPKMAERMQIEDRLLIDALVAHGAKTDELYPLDFTFSGPQDKLDIVQKDLEEEDFKVTRREKNTLHLRRELPLDLKVIYRFTSYMLMSAVAHDCQYEGWGCRLQQAAG